MTPEVPWHEQDEFWATFEPWMFVEERWEATPAEVDGLLEMLELEEGAEVLDLCCGPGRHSLELARRGFRVTGVDRTERYLNAARKRTEDEGLEVEFVQRDMRRFVRPRAFDAAINVFTSFGYFEDAADDELVLCHVRESLRDGGRFVLELMGKEVLARKFRPRDWRERDGVLMLEERKVCDAWSWIENRWIVIDGTDRREFSVRHRLYSAPELRDLLLGCGFAEVSVFGGLDGSEYDHEAGRLVLLATV